MSESVVHRCDVAVIGAGLGGLAAAEALGAQRVVLTCEVAWVGGQITAQGVSALDEHVHIETSGATASFAALRQRIRQWYRDHYGVSSYMAQTVNGPDMPLNPGNGWVSRLCFDPRVALEVIESQWADGVWPRPDVLLLNAVPATADVDESGRVLRVRLMDTSGVQHVVDAALFLDATDTGDLLPMTDTAYVSGAEADTGEPHASGTYRPRENQGFTFCFAVEYRPGENHTVSEPVGYPAFRDGQPYTLRPVGRDGQPVIYNMFHHSAQGNPPFWTYRRIHDGALLGGHDIALINWGSNDYHNGDILHATPDEREGYLDEARRLSLGFLHWLQTACPRDDGGFGYPEFKLRPDLTGTQDGLSQMPYIRESRRIRARTTVREQDVSAEYQRAARARHYPDSVGIGWYALDLHGCVDNPTASMYADTRPFQIPLGALIPQHTPNLLPACKNIGTTHLTNGAYRVHPVEWAVGAAAGHLAAFCIEVGRRPVDVAADPWMTWRLQYRLVRHGIPIFWAIDLPYYGTRSESERALFIAAQLVMVRDVLIPDSARWHSLALELDGPLGDDFALDRLGQVIDTIAARTGRGRHSLPHLSRDFTLRALLLTLYDPLKRALSD